MLVPAASPVRALAELRGRRVAFTKGSSAHLFVVLALATAGMSLSDISPAYLSPADAAAAFANGSLDAWAIWDPFLAIAQETQGARLILDGRAVAPTSGFFMAARTFAEGSPRVLAALLDALAGEAVWANAHHAEAGQIIQAATGLPGDIVDTALRRGPLAVVPVSDAVIRTQQANADTFRRLGVVPAAVDVRAAAWTGWTPAAAVLR